MKQLLHSISAGATEKITRDGKNLTHRRLRGPTTRKDMLKNALRDIANWQTRKCSNYTNVSNPCLVDHWFKKEELGSVGELPEVCSQNCLAMLVSGTNRWA